MSHQGVPCNRNREAQVCNLGPRGARIRLVGGIVLLAATVALAGCLVACHAHCMWRAALFLPLFFVFLLLLQARNRTCVVLAILGAWDLGCGVQRVPDRDLEKRLRHRAYGIVLASFAAALAATGLFFLV